MQEIEKHIEKILAEGAIGMAETARLVGTFRKGRGTHPSTVTRWCQDGIRLADGRRLRLENIRIGDRLMTSKAALMRFLVAQQEPAQVPDEAPRTPTERRRAASQAEAELAALGVG